MHHQTLSRREYPSKVVAINGPNNVLVTHGLDFKSHQVKQTKYTVFRPLTVIKIRPRSSSDAIRSMRELFFTVCSCICRSCASCPIVQEAIFFHGTMHQSFNRYLNMYNSFLVTVFLLNDLGVSSPTSEVDQT
jgi:hypothetical protein